LVNFFVMSRIGKLPVEIPSGVSVSLEKDVVSVKGPKGELSQRISPLVSVNVEENILTVSQAEESRDAKAVYGTTRSLIANMVKGVTENFSKNLLIEGVGFRATVKGKIIDLELGYSHPIEHPIPDGLAVTVSDNVKILVEGPDKQKVGQLAAEIKNYYPVEPYKGKGVRIVGEYVRRKEGKKVSIILIYHEFGQKKRVSPKAKVENTKKSQRYLRKTQSNCMFHEQKHPCSMY